MSRQDSGLPLPKPQRSVTRQVSFATTSQGETVTSTSSFGSSALLDENGAAWAHAYAIRSPPEKPEAFPYRLSGILSFPRRLFSPPKCSSCYAIDAAETGEAGLPERDPQSDVRPVDTRVKVGKPRSLKKTPLNRVQLKEILENRYQPPLTRKEFTNYLNWEERSSENHFFYSWLEGYTTQYEEWATTEARRVTSDHTAVSKHQPVTADNYAAYIASNLARRGEVVTGIVETETPSKLPRSVRPEDLPQHLRQTLSLALDAFFSPASPLQLNLDEVVVKRITADAALSPNPSIFKPAEEAVQLMLEDSLNRYLREVSGNASRYRSAFAVILGVIFVLTAFVPFALALHFHWHRALRLVCLPLLFLGTLTGVGGLRRTCIVIYLFGTARQLRMFELEMPTAAMQKPKVRRPPLWSSLSGSLGGRKESDADTAYEPHSLAEEKSARKKDSMATLAFKREDQLEEEGIETILPTLEHAAGAVPVQLSSPAALAGVVNILGLTVSASDISPAPSIQQEKPNKEHSMAVTPDTPCAPFTNPWDTMSLAGSTNDSATRLSRSSPVFASLTKVLAPEVIRAQRDAIVNGAQYGLAVTLIVGGIMLGVPDS